MSGADDSAGSGAAPHPASPGFAALVASAAPVVVAGGLAGWWGGPLAGVLVLGAAGLGLGLSWRREQRLMGRLEALAVAAGAGPPDGEESRRARASREAAAALQASLEADLRRAQAMVEATPNAVVLLSPEGRILVANQAAHELLRARRPEVVGRLPIEVFAVAELQDLIDAAATQGEGLPAGRSVVVGERDLHLEALPVSDHLMILGRDDTEARRADRARTDFVANVSHELRTPIAAIQGYAELLLADRERLPEDCGGMVEVIHRNGQRLSHLFDDLLNLHRIESRRRELPLHRLRLKPLLARAVSVAADRAAAKEQDFALHCADELAAMGNPEALSAILGNLATNASKYTPAGGRIRVRAEAVGREVVVSVQDTGVGIPEAHHARIFERFYRVDEGRARTAGGTGLGLAIAKHLALASGARLTFESVEGEGSTFRIHLPAEQGAARVAGAGEVERTWAATLPSGGGERG